MYDPRQIYIGQYHSRKKLEEYNLFWYYTVCTILDYLLMVAQSNEPPITVDNMEEYITKRDMFSKENIHEKYNRVVMDMIKLGLVNKDEEYRFYLLTDGLEALRNRNYHNTLASMLEAESSNRLAKLAIRIAIGSLLITLATFCYQIDTIKDYISSLVSKFS